MESGMSDNVQVTLHQYNNIMSMESTGPLCCDALDSFILCMKGLGFDEALIMETLDETYKHWVMNGGKL